MPTSRKQVFDAVVVGSGASGGWACKRLAEAGLKVALLDAGPPQKAENFTEHMAPFQMKYRDMARQVILKTRPIQGQFYECSETTYRWFAHDLDEPFTTYPGKPFIWGGRLRIGGGRTNVWGRLSLRYSDLDFKAASLDGYGVDWPLSYKDLAPYYDIVESYVGIAGQAEGNPVIPDGVFQPPMPMTCAEARFRDGVKAKLGRTITIDRTANLTQPLNGRPACHYCGPCERGCVTRSYFNSSFTTVPDAVKTGNCTYIPNAMAYKVLMDAGPNRARGISYIDRNSREPQEVFGRSVVLCAQTYESLRILLNSATRQYPNGLANSSGILGHYWMDHVAGGGAAGEFPDLQARPNINGPNRPAAFTSRDFATSRTGHAARISSAGTAMKGAVARVSTGMRRDSATPTSSRFIKGLTPYPSQCSVKSLAAGTTLSTSIRRSKTLTAFRSCASMRRTARTKLPCYEMLSTQQPKCWRLPAPGTYAPWSGTFRPVVFATR